VSAEDSDRPNPRLRTRLVFAGTVAAALAIAVAAALLAPPDRSPTLTPFVTGEPPVDHVPVPLVPADGGRAGDTLTLRLSVADAGALAAHDEVRLAMATYRTRPRLVRGALNLAGTPCSWETPPGARLRDNRPLPFRRGAGCADATVAAPAELILELTVAGRGRAAVWATAAEPGHPARLVVGELTVEGWGVDLPAASRLRRIDLLAAMWSSAAGAAWIWLVLAAALALFFGGLAGIPPQPRPARDGPAGARRFTVACVAGAFALALALAAVHAVLNPPLSGPDEPGHLGALLRLAGQGDRLEEVQAWAEATHLQRIRFHPDQRFHPEDIGRPLADAITPDLEPPLVDRRSAATAAWWRLVGPAVAPLSLPGTLLAVRLLDGLLFAAAVALVVGLLAVGSAAPFPQLVVVPFLLVPALPFFATHVSETAVVAAGHVVLAGSILAIVLGGPWSGLAGAPLGAAAMVLLAGGRHAWPMAGLVVAALICRFSGGDRRVHRPLLDGAVFWAGAAAAITAGALMLDQPFLSGVSWRVDRYVGIPGESALGWVAARLWAVWAVAAAGWGFEILMARLGRHTPVFLRTAAPWACRCGGLAGAAVLLATVVASPLVRMPTLPAIQVTNQPRLLETAPGLPEYVGSAVAAALTMFRPTDPDLLLSATFWAGFGWLDAFPPKWLTAGLLVATGLALASLLVLSGCSRDAGRCLRLAILAAGWLATIATYAYACHKVPVNLHGRYLVGWHLAVIAVAWSVLLLPWPTRQKGRPSLGGVARPWPFLALALAGHAVALHAVLARYF